MSPLNVVTRVLIASEIRRIPPKSVDFIFSTDLLPNLVHFLLNPPIVLRNTKMSVFVGVYSVQYSASYLFIYRNRVSD